MKWLLLTSGLGLPLRAEESAYESLGITLPGTFHRAAELGQRDRAVERDTGHEL